MVLKDQYAYKTVCYQQLNISSFILLLVQYQALI